MVASEIIEYVREQLKAGYETDDIQEALRSQGWNDQEINEAFSLVETHQGPQQKEGVFPPVKIHRHNNKGFIITLLGGLLIFIVGLETVLSLPLLSSAFVQMGIAFSILGMFESALISSLNVGVVLLIFAIFMILSSLIIKGGDRQRMGGIIAIVFGILTIVGFNGLLLVVGAVLGIVGGLLGLKKS